MRTEQKIFNELIETIVNNSENNEAKITNVELWAKTWKEEMNQALTLTGVSQQRELLKGCTELNDDIKFERKSSARVFNNEKGIWEFI